MNSINLKNYFIYEDSVDYTSISDFIKMLTSLLYFLSMYVLLESSFLVSRSVICVTVQFITN